MKRLNICGVKQANLIGMKYQPTTSVVHGQLIWFKAEYQNRM